MKLRILLIVGLLVAACLIVPAFAAVRTSQDFPETFDHKVTVVFDKVYESDTSDIYSPQNYPPTQYKFVTIDYSLYNPTSSDIRYEFNVVLEDQNGNTFQGQNFIVAETVPAGGSLQNRYKEYAIYRNSTDYYIVWHDKQTVSPWLDQTYYLNITYPAPTPEPTEAPTATPIAPTATAEPGNGSIGQHCIPFLPIGLVMGGMGGMGLLSKRVLNQRR